jgi:hypothetical protein
MTTTTTPTPAAALATPGGYRIRVPFTACGAYELELTKAAAKAICAEYLDPSEKWEDQAEHTLETALEGAIEELFNEHLLNFPAVINSKIEGRALALKFIESSSSLEIEYLEVEA